MFDDNGSFVVAMFELTIFIAFLMCLWWIFGDLFRSRPERSPQDLVGPAHHRAADTRRASVPAHARQRDDRTRNRVLQGEGHDLTMTERA